MSCDTRRRTLFKALLGDVSGADLTALEAQFMAQCGPAGPDDDLADNLQKTHAILLLCDRFGLPRPVHSRSGIPKPRTHRAYAWLFDELARRGVFAPPVAEDAPLVPADQVPIGALAQYDCGCAVLRIATPDGLSDRPWMLRLHDGPACDHERPASTIEWVKWDEPLRVVSPPPPRPRIGIVAELVAPGRFPAIEQELNEVRREFDVPELITEVARVALLHPSARADPSIRAALLGEALVHAGWKQDKGVRGHTGVDRVTGIALGLDSLGLHAEADQLLEHIGLKSDRARAYVTRACEQPQENRERLITAALKLIAREAPSWADTTLTSCAFKMRKIGDVASAVRMLNMIDSPVTQSDAIIYAARWFPPDSSHLLMTLARGVGTQDNDRTGTWLGGRARAMAALIDRQPSAEQPSLVDEILDLTEDASVDHWRMQTITSAGRYMSSAQASRAAHILDTIDVRDPHEHGWAIEAYAAVLPQLAEPERPAYVNRTLDMALAQPAWRDTGGSYRADALGVLIPCLDGDARSTAVGEFFATVGQMPRSWHQAEAIRDVAPHLTPAERTPAIALAETITDEQERLRAIAALIQSSNTT